MTDSNACALPSKAEVGGYVYVFGFSDGRIKVGMTTDPRQSRLRWS